MIWNLAEKCDAVPMPTSPAVGHMLDEWRELPESFGCTSAHRTSPTFVVLPDPRRWCGVCAIRRAEHERRCAVCHGQVEPEQCAPVVIQADPDVMMFCLIHDECEAVGR